METRPGKRYATDLTDPQWAEIEEFLDSLRDPSQGGRPRQYPRRWIADAVFCQLRTGAQWRLLPGDLPAWTAYGGSSAAGVTPVSGI
jgi:putative transposase